MGGFQQGSTILLFAPAGFRLHEAIVPGARIRMGQALMCLPAHGGDNAGVVETGVAAPSEAVPA